MEKHEKRIREGNKLIQQFIGMPVFWWNDPDPIEDNDYWITSMECISDEMIRIQYGGGSEAEVLPGEIEEVILDIHEDWYLLMEAIEKIESLEIDEHEYFTVNICGGNNPYIESSTGEIIAEIAGLELTKIEATHKVVVEFLVWLES